MVGWNLGCVGPTVLPLHTLQEAAVKARSYEWRSWQWQVENVPAPSAWAPGLRMFVVDEGSVAQVVARQAWYQLDRATLSKFAVEVGVAVDPGDDLFQLVWKMVQEPLLLDDKRTLQIVQRRLARSTDNECIDDIFLQIDEAAELVEHIDMKEVLHHKDHMVKRRCVGRALLPCGCSEQSGVRDW